MSRTLRSNHAYALIGVIILSGVLSLSAIKGLKRSAVRRAAIQSMKAKFEQQALFRQISKRLYNFHACLNTLGGSSGPTAVNSIKNHTGDVSFEVGKKYGRNFVKFESANLAGVTSNSANLEITLSRLDKRKGTTSGKIKKT